MPSSANETAKSRLNALRRIGQIAFEQSGAGPAIILVLGAFNDRATGAPLSRSLEPHFSVFNYDRRGARR